MISVLNLIQVWLKNLETWSEFPEIAELYLESNWNLIFFPQLDSADEQAAAIRRELDGRKQRVTEMERNRKLMPKFVLKEMESLYTEELGSSINLLMANLESLPVSKGSMDSKYGLGIKKKYNHRWVAPAWNFKWKAVTYENTHQKSPLSFRRLEATSKEGGIDWQCQSTRKQGGKATRKNNGIKLARNRYRRMDDVAGGEFLLIESYRRK